MSPPLLPGSSAGPTTDDVVDFLVVGSGFGGSVAAMRLREKGYSVLVLERGRRFRDQDFARTNWNLRRYLWAPALRCFGILQVSPFRDVFDRPGAEALRARYCRTSCARISPPGLVCVCTFT